MRSVVRAVLCACVAFTATLESQSPPEIAWARIPAGMFQMGCVPGDTGCGGDEHPRHLVTLSRPFELMTTEVTVGMYRAGGFEVEDQPPWSTTPDQPVVVVTWEGARAFCAAVGGRLPTEAEWEFAARGGRVGSVYPWGDDPPVHRRAATNGAAFEGDAAEPVKSFGPNAYGLYDMAGNVWEWVADWGGFYNSAAVTDPASTFMGSPTRVVRGGSYGDDEANLRVSNRNPNAPERTNVNVGFRCARDVVAVGNVKNATDTQRPQRSS